MKLRDFPNSRLKYHSWFFNDGGSEIEPNDYFKIEVTNGIDTVLLENFEAKMQEWTGPSIFDLATHISLNDSIQVIFSAEDLSPNHLVEAAIDGFEMILDSNVGTEDSPMAVQGWRIIENPVKDQLLLTSDHNQESVKLQIFDIGGRLLHSSVHINYLKHDEIVVPGKLINGVYFIKILMENGKTESLKFIVHR